MPNPPSFQPVDWMNEPIRVFVNDTLLLGGASIYPPICFAIPSSLQAAAPVLNGCISTSLKGMLTDSPRSDGKRLLVFITADAGGARKTI